MTATTGWQFAVEINPTSWRFPSGQSWIAGWIQPTAGQGMTDVRARLHHRIIFGLSGLPHPAFTEILPGQRHPIRPGFSFSLAPQLGATLLQLEARDASGRWTEFFRTTILAAPDALVAGILPQLGKSLGGLVRLLLKQRLRTPRRSWAELADGLLANFVAEPLNAHPNAPLAGAMEEPQAIGRRRNGCVPVTGWLAHPTARITQLSAVIDSLPVAILAHGLARPDVAGIFPDLRDRDHSAFVGEIPLPDNFDGPVLLKLFAELDNGQTHLAYARRFTPQPHGDTGQMPPSIRGFNFMCAVWALQRSTGRYRIPLQGLTRAAWKLWISYRAIPVFRPKNAFPVPGQSVSRRQDGRPRFIPAQSEPASDLPFSAGLNPAPGNTIIATADDMCGPDPSHYFQLGREALTLVEQASTRAGNAKVEAILDLPCGHGRVARWLRTAYPAARLTVCDTQKPGVAFCVSHLEANGVIARLDGSHWAELSGPYDIVWCGSLLTHFGREDWVVHLRRFAERLTPHGVLVITTHGRHVLAKLQSGEKDYGLPEAKVSQLCSSVLAEGFGYVDYPDTPAYGISVAQPAWILDLITRETRLQVLDFRESAWDQHQDVVVCALKSASGRGPEFH